MLGYQEAGLAKAQTRQGHSVYVVTGNKFCNNFYSANKELLGGREMKEGLYVENEIRVWRLPVVFELPISHNPVIKGLEKKILELRPDIVFVHEIVNINALRLAFLRRRMPKTKFVFDDHMTYDVTRGSWTKLLYAVFKIFFSKHIAKSADALVAVTNQTKDFMVRMYGLHESDIFVIPLGCDANAFKRDEAAGTQVRNDCGFSERDVVFIYAGKIIPKKGVHLLVDAFIRLSHKHARAKLLLIGGGDPNYLQSLKSVISSNSMGNSIAILKPVANKILYRFFSAGNVGVWPEGCSIAALEAMSCGLPVILSDKSGALERISHQNGFRYIDGDVNDLENKMRLMMDEAVRNRMGSNARRYVELLDWSLISDRTLSAIGT